MSIKFGERVVKFKFGDLNAQCHRHACVEFKLAILNLATLEKFAKSPNLKPRQSFLLHDTSLSLTYHSP